MAQYCSKFLPDCIKDTEEYKEGQLGPALVDAFLKFDSTLVQDEIIKELKLLAGVDENDEEEDGNWHVTLTYSNLFVGLISYIVGHELVFLL